MGWGFFSLAIRKITMKKSRLAILLTMTFILAGCDDANLSQKVIETEKQFVQLQTDYKKSQADLTAKENEKMS